jgi:hypothetical protein
MLDLDALKKDPSWSKIIEQSVDTWAPYEKPIDFSEWPIEWIKQVPKPVREGKPYDHIDSIMLTK